MKKNRFNYYKLKNGIDFHFYNEKKFKKNYISFYLLTKDSKYNTAEYALLCDLLSRRTNDIDEAQLSLKEQELYCSGVKFSVEKDVNFIGVRATIIFINNKHIEDVSNDVFKLFIKQLFNPFMKDGLFNKVYFNNQKETAINAFNNSMIKKDAVANINFRSHLDQNHPISSRAKYAKDDVYELSNQRVSDLYKEVLNYNLFINAVGDFDKNLVVDCVNNYFKDNKPIVDKLKTIKYETSHEDVVDYDNRFNQAVIKRLFSFDCKEKDIFAAILANNILGSGGSNLLFTNIREKEGLCYQVSSGYNHDYRTLIVSLSCNPTDVDRCNQLIDENISKLQNGDFDKKLFDNAKIMYLQGYESVFDTPLSCKERDFNQFINGHNYDVKESRRFVKQVTLKKAICLTKSIKPLFTYVLTKEK